ncbi:MAG: hypothetical protein IT449_05910 [Phycisphaerales bacterium]|nr:hypothetical protein [Phycisphaerales bacterium]
MQLSTSADASPATISLAQPDPRKVRRRAVSYGFVVALMVLACFHMAMTDIPSTGPAFLPGFIFRVALILLAVCAVGLLLVVYLTQRYETAYCRLRGTRLIFGRWTPFEIEIDNIEAIEIRGQMGSVVSLDTSHGLGIVLEEPVTYRGSSECRWSTRLRHRFQHCHVFFPNISDKSPQELAAAIVTHAWRMGAGVPPVYSRNYAGRRRLLSSEFLPEREVAQWADGEALPATDTVPCRGCGYDLRASLASSACPECGSPVEMSMREESLAFADRRWLKSMRAGALLFSVAAAWAAGAAFLPALFVAAALDGAVSGRQMILLTSWSWATILLPACSAAHLLGRRDPTLSLPPPGLWFEPWIRRIGWGVFLASAAVVKTLSAPLPGMVLLGWMIALVALGGFWRVRALLLQSGSDFSAAVSVGLQFILWMAWIMMGAGMLCVGILALIGVAVKPPAAASPRTGPPGAMDLIHLAIPLATLCMSIAVLSLRAAVMARRELRWRSQAESVAARLPNSESGSPRLSS